MKTVCRGCGVAVALNLDVWNCLVTPVGSVGLVNCDRSLITSSSLCDMALTPFDKVEYAVRLTAGPEGF